MIDGTHYNNTIVVISYNIIRHIINNVNKHKNLST